MEDFYAMCSTGDGDKMEASMCERMKDGCARML